MYLKDFHILVFEINERFKRSENLIKMIKQYKNSEKV